MGYLLFVFFLWGEISQQWPEASTSSAASPDKTWKSCWVFWEETFWIQVISRHDAKSLPEANGSKLPVTVHKSLFRIEIIIYFFNKLFRYFYMFVFPNSSRETTTNEQCYVHWWSFKFESVLLPSLINQTLMAHHCVLHLSFNPKCFALVRGYSAEKIFQRGYITEKRLRTTALHCVVAIFTIPPDKWLFLIQSFSTEALSHGSSGRGDRSRQFRSGLYQGLCWWGPGACLLWKQWWHWWNVEI